MSFNPNLTQDERKTLSALKVDILEDADLRKLYAMRHKHKVIVRKLMTWAKSRRRFFAHRAANPLGDFYSLSK